MLRIAFGKRACGLWLTIADLFAMDGNTLGRCQAKFDLLAVYFEHNHADCAPDENLFTTIVFNHLQNMASADCRASLFQGQAG